MRHLLGFVLGLVLAAVGTVLTAWGIGELVLDGALQEPGPATLGHVLLVVGGVVLGLTAAARRVSPLAPVVGGLGLLGLGIAEWVDPGLFLRVSLQPQSLETGVNVVLQLGLPLVLGALLVVLALVPQGRRPRRTRGDDGRDDDGFTAVPSTTPQAWSPPAG